MHLQVSASGPAGASARAELGLEDDFYSTSAGQREKALASTDRLNKTGDRIQHGRQQLLETEVRGRSTLICSCMSIHSLWHQGRLSARTHVGVCEADPC